MSVVLYDLCAADAGRRFSPYCWRVKMALAHKAIEVETRATPFTAIPSELAGVSKTVPVLVDGDTTVGDSWDIACYLEEHYPDRPSLFGGIGGEKLSRFIESWVNTSVHAALGSMVMKDIHDALAPQDQAYFRETREKRFGRTLEQLHEGRESRLDAFQKVLQPMRQTLKTQPYIGGESPLYADYILFGTLQWPRIVSPLKLLEDDDPVQQWFERCLDLYEGMARRTPLGS